MNSVWGGKVLRRMNKLEKLTSLIINAIFYKHHQGKLYLPSDFFI